MKHRHRRGAVRSGIRYIVIVLLVTLTIVVPAGMPVPSSGWATPTPHGRVLDGLSARKLDGEIPPVARAKIRPTEPRLPRR